MIKEDLNGLFLFLRTFSVFVYVGNNLYPSGVQVSLLCDEALLDIENKRVLLAAYAAIHAFSDSKECRHFISRH